MNRVGRPGWWTLRNRFILAFLVVALLPLVITSLYGNWTTSRTLEEQAIETALADLRLRAGQIEGYLGGAREDLLFLSRVDGWQGLPTGLDAEQLSDITAAFVHYVDTHPDVFQARFIDMNGQEVIRVDQDGRGSRIVPPAELQNKADRYYFSAAMQLQEGEVYVSPVDLNREYDRVQEPYVPTLRYATPVFGQNGQRGGFVILNLYAEPFLRFARQDGDEGMILALIDGAGYYLTHPDPAHEWGSPVDLNTGYAAKADYPEIWQEMLVQSSGVHIPPVGNWWRGLVDALFIPGGGTADRRVVVYQAVSISGDAAPRWLLLHDAPGVNLFASVSQFRLTAGLILGLTILGAAGMAVVLARSLSAPITRLTWAVRQYGYGRTSRTVPPAGSGDEIAELSAAFQQMSDALDQHLEQLSLLSRAGHHITARLGRAEVLQAVVTAVERLFPARFVCITLDQQVLHTAGEESWARHRQRSDVQSVLLGAAQDGHWHTMGLTSESGPAGFLCCAPICVDGRLGLIELYGPDDALGEPASGELLATLAIQVSISLDNAALYSKLDQRSAELQSLLERLISAQEEERRVVAYDIHDGLIQMLVAARLQYSNYAAERTGRSVKAEESLGKGMAQLTAAIVEARRIIEGLRPATLDDFGLVLTVRQVAEETCAACCCELEFSANVGGARLPRHLETTAFRIMQEAIYNARKYAQMTRLRVTLQRENGCLEMEVRDWGQGFDTGRLENRQGVGLISMQERARLVGGRCKISSQPGSGTRVWVSLPIAAEGLEGQANGPG